MVGLHTVHVRFELSAENARSVAGSGIAFDDRGSHPLKSCQASGGFGRPGAALLQPFVSASALACALRTSTCASASGFNAWIAVPRLSPASILVFRSANGMPRLLLTCTAETNSPRL